MKVAIVYNDISVSKISVSHNKSEDNLNFEPHFEIEDYDSESEFNLIASLLIKSGYEAYTLNIKDNIKIFLDDYKKNKPDVVFNLVELFRDTPSLEMSFCGLLELLNIPYTGAPPITLGTCQNKVLTKGILSSNGIRTPKFIYIKEPKNDYPNDLQFPVIVKPSLEDASVGIDVDAVVENYDKLKKRINYIFKEYKQPVLVEEFIEGRELNVAVVGDRRPKVLPISEIDFSEMPDNLYNFVSYQAKWDPYHESYHKTIPVCPSQLPRRIEITVHETALRCFHLLGLRDYARIDMRLSKDNKIYVLEANPNPDLTEDAGFIRSMKAAKYSYRSSLKMIVDFAIKRNKRKNLINASVEK
ncbi:MAG: D-alanine--D-alanine ligase [Ignavibacteriales bacterium CG_4_9_14_3_um_filter_34_10]|nr:MAG: D-alanine--D-alanine ligase [Ignavibacteriales bacterium CG_4_9_14_3_um_filter_34_10]